MQILKYEFERAYGGEVVAGSHEFRSTDGHFDKYTRTTLGDKVIELAEEESKGDIREHPRGAIFIIPEESPEYRLLMKRAEKKR
ncbi:MAG: hypothetical protein U9Q06_04030 [Nanoarchaeota archaeon]|nr:hypothetical protein [Nanoarchaeota archaeon]